MLTFNDFKKGPGRAICQRLGVRIDACRSWDDFTLSAVRSNARGALIKRAHDLDEVASPGERLLLQAILHAADFDWLADELTGGRVWRRMSSLDDAYRDAVLSCIARQEVA